MSQSRDDSRRYRHRRGQVVRTQLTGRGGILIVAASALVGAIVTILTGGQPGALLGACVLAGTIAGGIAVSPRASRVMIPVPALVYPVAAVMAGIVGGSAAGSSHTALAVGAVQWVAAGFPWMVAATASAVIVAVMRKRQAMQRTGHSEPK